MNVALYDTDILQRVPGCKFILYEDIDTLDSIEQLLPKTLVLYQLADIGHFCSVFINSEGLNFFDPLGHRVDYFLNKISREQQIMHDQDHPYLTRLFMKEKNKIPLIYNNHRLQGTDTQTCGHWNTIRLLYSDLKKDEFADCFKGIKNKDAAIVKLYNEL